MTARTARASAPTSNSDENLPDASLVQVTSMFFKKSTPPGPASAGPASYEEVVRRELASADAETIAIVTAIAGLLGGVAYADRQVSPDELQVLRSALARIQGLTEAGVRAIEHALTRDATKLSTLDRPRHTRTLVELADRSLRLEVLGLLLELAAADGTISLPEVTTLRTIATALGLDQSDYNQLQARYRDKLGSLK